MKIEGSTALVTGATRGLGLAISLALRDAGATVYAGARDPGAVTAPGLIPIALDVTDPAAVAVAAQRAGDVDLLVNNAGILVRGSALTQPFEEIRSMFETNLFGMLHVTRAFAPVLARNGGGALVDIASVRSWSTAPQGAAYAATKAAMWSLTNAFRAELREQGTLVVGVHVGLLDTEPQAGVVGDKLDPADLAQQILVALEADAEEVLGDAGTRHVKSLLTGPPTLLAS
jgi:NAD(P)-dependent dehydrogenase (short-subunit alcohol dehydrogenase family)